MPDNPKLAIEWKEWWFDSCKNVREPEMMYAGLPMPVIKADHEARVFTLRAR